MKQQYKTIDEYIKTFPEDVQLILKKMRRTIRKMAPNSEEVISYQMPAFEQNGIVVWFGAFKKHIGFYPKASGIKAFQKELSPYKFSKGSIQFPLDEAIPCDLIEKIVEFRVKENLSQQKGRRTY
jgi:uncharacterized protein YdhG (YjbR/CyaY superfamily)